MYDLSILVAFLIFSRGPWLSVLQMAKVLEMSPWEVGDYDLVQLA